MLVLDMECARKKEAEDNSKSVGLNNSTNGVAIYNRGKHVESNRLGRKMVTRSSVLDV